MIKSDIIQDHFSNDEKYWTKSSNNNVLKKNSKILIGYVLVLLVLVLASFKTPIQLVAYGLDGETSLFSIDKPATKEDWQFFFRSTYSWQQTLWNYFKKQNKSLKDWHWTWRMGWIKVCTNLQGQWCKDIIKEGILDKAAVVRAEASVAIGRIYENTFDKEMIELLQQAYILPANYDRKGQPIFTCFRILQSLSVIGGAQQVAEKLASSHPVTKEYLAKLAGQKS